MRTNQRSRRRPKNDRGSALLVSLMVIVGLSLLGLGFVAISETETAIARNQQTILQTQAVAEAGAKTVVEWFQDPKWGMSYAALPANDVTVNPKIDKIKVERTYLNDGVKTTGFYKPNATALLFDKPYRPKEEHRFFADENTGDIIINRSTDPDTIDKFNDILLGKTLDDKRNGEVTEIRIYSPPMVNATVVTNGKTNPDGTPQQFWTGGQRYGLATIKVTAQLFRDPSLTDTSTPKKTDPSNVLSSHSVRLVVGEIPLPIPGGPIQSNTAIAFNGDFVVHWGNETSTGDLKNKRFASSIPWANAYEHLHFEHGYETGNTVASITITSAGTGYSSAPTVTISNPPAGGTTATATATVTAGSVTGITITDHGKGYVTVPPNWAPDVTITGGGGTGAAAVAAIGAQTWPITPANYENADFFHEVLSKDFDDPWFGSRSGLDNMADGATSTNTFFECFDYTYDDDELATNDASNSFQWQNVNKYEKQKKVLFPVINYDLWKRIAQGGRGYKGIYYFAWSSGTNFRKNDNGPTKDAAYWANSLTPGQGPGVYFFDTRDKVNPQKLTGAAKLAELTPAMKWSAGDLGKNFLMEGFVYVNAEAWGTTGGGSSPTTVQANFPGEMFRDIGAPVLDASGKKWDTSCAGQICRTGAGDGIFTYVDLNGNKKFDVVTMKAPAWVSYDPGGGTTAHAAGSTYIPKVWKDDAQATVDYGKPCTVPAAGYDGTNPAPDDCSEPHEPYLNMIYPTQGTNSTTIGWEESAPGKQTRRPVVLDGSGNPISCSDSSKAYECTSNAYDIDGAIVPLDVILDGVFYNEGDYDSQGNDAFFGSILIQGQVLGTGTPDVWFDEKLIKGTWAPPNMPRVIVYNEQTDEQASP